MVEVLVDTDVLVDHLRGTSRFEARGRRVHISAVTHCELFAGRDDEAILRGLLDSMTTIPVDAEIAELAGITRRETQIATPDALIAATALRRGLPLVTRNRRHFERVPELLVVAPS